MGESDNGSVARRTLIVLGLTLATVATLFLAYEARRVLTWIVIAVTGRAPSRRAGPSRCADQAALEKGAASRRPLTRACHVCGPTTPSTSTGTPPVRIVACRSRIAASVFGP